MRARKIIVGLLLLLGVQTWLLFAGRGGAYWGRNIQLWMLLGIAAIACVPRVTNQFARCLARVAHPSRRTALIAAIGIAIAASTYLYLDARYQKRTFTPKYHDEFSYIIQTHMVADGRLWAPLHPCFEFFETFQLVAFPTYASIYFPGAAFLYVPGVWLGFPPWMMPLIYAGVVVGLVFLVVTELLDAVSGFLAALLVVGNEIFRLQSLQVMAQIPAMLLILLMFYAWLRWRERRSTAWAIAIGACAGWCAITRPLDAAIASIPIGLAMLLSIRRSNWRELARSIAIVIVAAVPFLLIQLGLNKSFTGDSRVTPFSWYAERYLPQTTYGFHEFNPSGRPRSPRPQIQAYYEQTALPRIREHTPRNAFFGEWGDHRLRQTIVSNVPTWLTLVLLPAGIYGVLRDRRKLVLFAILPVFVLLYSFYTFYLPHYNLTAAASVVLLLVTGVDVISRTWPRARHIVYTFLTLSLASLTISELPEFNRIAQDERFDGPQLQEIDRQLAQLPADQSAIVLFRFSPTANHEEEPVYNIEATYPDQARIIRAHDRGAANIRLFRYYAVRHPDRAVYIYDRGDDSLTYQGMVKQLANVSPPEPPMVRPPTRPPTRPTTRPPTRPGILRSSSTKGT